jgi:hypothetical protein
VAIISLTEACFRCGGRAGLQGAVAAKGLMQVVQRGLQRSCRQGMGGEGLRGRAAAKRQWLPSPVHCLQLPGAACWVCVARHS